jgi:sRNA-binding carbon storage regulator CsrA
MDLHPGERLVLGDTGVEVQVVHKSGKASRLRVVAPRSISIMREGCRTDEPTLIPSMPR